jgi:DNA repair protein RadC
MMKLIKEDDPNYKIVDKGSAALTDSEILAVVMGGRDPLVKAQRILSKVDNSYALLAKMSYTDIVSEGITHMQAVRIIASNSFGHRKKIAEMPHVCQIKCSRDVYELMEFMRDLPHEEFWLLFLNRSNKVISKMKVSQGGISGTVTDIRIIMKKAIENLASGIICCHNHPSGNLSPSESDTKITQKIKDSGNLMDIQLLDHIIVSDKDYYSFADNGLL